jgi:hydrogenase nickel incorporation protein HypA/HybF
MSRFGKAPGAEYTQAVHELSIAMSLVDAACEKAATLGPVRVTALHLRLGPLSGVVREALTFSFDLAAAGTPIEGARLAIEEVPVTVLCPLCRVERQLESLQHFRCPACGTPTPEVVRGRELELAAMEIEDLAPPPAAGARDGEEAAGHATADR